MPHMRKVLWPLCDRPSASGNSEPIVPSAARNTAVFRALIAFTCAFPFLSAIAAAQTLVCLQDPKAKADGPCKIEVGSGINPIVLRVLDADGHAVANAKIQFGYPSRGPFQDSLRTDVNGIAIANWNGAKDPGETPVTIKMDVSAPTWHLQKTLILSHKLPALPSSLALSPDHNISGNNQYWYAGKQLPDSLVILVTGVPADSDCRKSVVNFRAIGSEAEVSPDSVHGTSHSGVCTAAARWRLGKVVGDQYLRAFLSDHSDMPLIMHAGARATPWLAAGLAVTYDWAQFEQVKSTVQNVQVTTKSADGNTSMTTTNSVTTSKPDSVKRGVTFSPLIGINTPILTAWHNVRGSVSADARKLSTDWFAGLSLTQFRNGIYNEDIGVDLQAILHLGRRDILVNATECAMDGTTCKTQSHTRLLGAGLVVQLNASSFLTTFTGLFSK